MKTRKQPLWTGGDTGRKNVSPPSPLPGYAPATGKEGEIRPAEAPEVDPVDFCAVPFPGWAVRLYDSLCEVYGWQQGFSDFMLSLIEPDLRKSLESRTGQAKGLASTLMALACQSLPTRELDAVTACSRAEVNAYDREIARRMAAAPDLNALLPPSGA